MMTENRHIIRRVTLELHLNEDRGRHALESKIKALLKDKVMYQLKAEMDRLSNGDQTLRIDRLELDLGRIDKPRLKQDFPSRTLDKFREEAKGMLVQREVTATQKNDRTFEAFTFYLKQGHFPWWFTEAHSQSLDEVVYRLLVADAPQLLGLIRKEVRAGLSAVKRLRGQLRSVTLGRLVTVAMPTSAQKLEKHLDWVVLHVLDGEPAPSQSPWKQEVWQKLFMTVACSSPTQLTTNVVYETVVKQLAVKWKTSTASARERLLSETKQSLAPEGLSGLLQQHLLPTNLEVVTPELSTVRKSTEESLGIEAVEKWRTLPEDVREILYFLHHGSFPAGKNSVSKRVSRIWLKLGRQWHQKHKKQLKEALAAALESDRKADYLAALENELAGMLALAEVNEVEGFAALLANQLVGLREFRPKSWMAVTAWLGRQSEKSTTVAAEPKPTTVAPKGSNNYRLLEQWLVNGQWKGKTLKGLPVAALMRVEHEIFETMEATQRQDLIAWRSWQAQIWRQAGLRKKVLALPLKQFQELNQDTFATPQLNLLTMLHTSPEEALIDHSSPESNPSPVERSLAFWTDLLWWIATKREIPVWAGAAFQDEVSVSAGFRFTLKQIEQKQRGLARDLMQNLLSDPTQFQPWLQRVEGPLFWKVIKVGFGTERTKKLRRYLLKKAPELSVVSTAGRKKQLKALSWTLRLHVENWLRNQTESHAERTSVEPAFETPPHLSMIQKLLRDGTLPVKWRYLNQEEFGHAFQVTIDNKTKAFELHRWWQDQARMATASLLPDEVKSHWLYLLRPDWEPLSAIARDLFYIFRKRGFDTPTLSVAQRWFQDWLLGCQTTQLERFDLATWARELFHLLCRDLALTPKEAATVIAEQLAEDENLSQSMLAKWWRNQGEEADVSSSDSLNNTTPVPPEATSETSKSSVDSQADRAWMDSTDHFSEEQASKWLEALDRLPETLFGDQDLGAETSADEHTPKSISEEEWEAAMRKLQDQKSPSESSADTPRDDESASTPSFDHDTQRELDKPKAISEEEWEAAMRKLQDQKSSSESSAETPRDDELGSTPSADFDLHAELDKPKAISEEEWEAAMRMLEERKSPEKPFAKAPTEETMEAQDRPIDSSAVASSESDALQDGRANNGESEETTAMSELYDEFDYSSMLEGNVDATTTFDAAATFELSPKAVADIMAYFLLFGELPWWSALKSAEELSNLLQSTIQKSAPVFREHLHELLAENALKTQLGELLNQVDRLEQESGNALLEESRQAAWDAAANYLKAHEPGRLKLQQHLRYRTDQLVNWWSELPGLGAHLNAIDTVQPLLEYLSWPQPNQYQQYRENLMAAITEEIGDGALASGFEISKEADPLWQRMLELQQVVAKLPSEIGRFLASAGSDEEMEQLLWLSAFTWRPSNAEQGASQELATRQIRWWLQIVLSWQQAANTVDAGKVIATEGNRALKAWLYESAPGEEAAEVSYEAKVWGELRAVISSAQKKNGAHAIQADEFNWIVRLLMKSDCHFDYRSVWEAWLHVQCQTHGHSRSQILDRLDERLTQRGGFKNVRRLIRASQLRTELEIDREMEVETGVLLGALQARTGDLPDTTQAWQREIDRWQQWNSGGEASPENDHETAAVDETDTSSEIETKPRELTETTEPYADGWWYELAYLSQEVPVWWPLAEFLHERSRWWLVLANASNPAQSLTQLFQLQAKETGLSVATLLEELKLIVEKSSSRYSQLQAWLSEQSLHESDRTELHATEHVSDSEEESHSNEAPASEEEIEKTNQNKSGVPAEAAKDELVERFVEVLKEASYDLPTLLNEHLESFESDPIRQERFYEVVRERHNWAEPTAAEDNIYLENAGLVLLWPFYARLFTNLGLVEDKEFKGPEERERALQLLQYLVWEEAGHPEHQLPLNKLLCGLLVSEPVKRLITITDQEKTELDNFLKAVISQWKPVSNTSLDGFRSSFLQREGILYRKKSNWYVKVEQQAMDVILKTLPWGLTVVNLPWNEELIYVEWSS